VKLVKREPQSKNNTHKIKQKFNKRPLFPVSVNELYLGGQTDCGYTYNELNKRKALRDDQILSRIETAKKDLFPASLGFSGAAFFNL
jgi:hypothetical protein